MAMVFPTLEGKCAIITGGASGFGEGLAKGFAARGASVALADMNEAGAVTKAKEIEDTYGVKAIGIGANVSDEKSVKEMVEKAVAFMGSLDVFISCAGILTAGALDVLSKEQFERVTAVNYTGYFLCAKYASAVMKEERKTDETRMFDIIEINSKSGLAGSKMNFAYAGSKFGGIGLTQSFALELAPYGIKVNAICPGNLLDGPLWSDPERGLFKQYLDTGKVKGAKTIADVRAYYEGQVPLGRGCEIEDVVRAAEYIVLQKYETGQAVPVTGGQVMLS
ncbi:MAG: SDR family NAD(P)-dependent oxidoreductase [Lachnospiraceae bacterium]|jgi:sorbitol-6-phosphate 2-dehydrogenase|nr:SDR family NAD(P)-dependent oxidoreductase [Lachnospiraceae bacterium]